MIKSYCKINLSLRVINKLKNGLHNIQSNVFLINFFDEINIRKINKKNDNIIFNGRFKRPINKKKNSISEILNILRLNKLIKRDVKYQITVNKKIPVFSGLGGGTSNAAFIFKYFVKKKINSTILKQVEKKVGSDFKLFFYNQSHLINLQKIEKFKKKHHFYFVLVYPNVKCSTKKIYAKVKNYRYKTNTNISKVHSRAKFIEAIKKEQNDLQQIAVSKFNSLDLLINFIKILKGCHFSRMTGSGSVCFGMFDNKKSATFEVLGSMPR